MLVRIAAVEEGTVRAKDKDVALKEAVKAVRTEAD
jgi:hypothetical protein